MNVTSCRFERAAVRPEDEPRQPGPDVVFLGRSNVGKSALINKLLGVRGLARTSSRPGRTQTVNFYRVNERFWFVDLPGYGFADVPEAVRRSWKPMIEGVLDRRRDRLARGVLVLDARHEPTQEDRTMRDWLVDRGVSWLALGTKADKLSGNGRTKAERTLARAIGRSDLAEPILVSAQTGLGIPAVWRHLDRALAAAEPARG